MAKNSNHTSFSDLATALKDFRQSVEVLEPKMRDSTHAMLEMLDRADGKNDDVVTRAGMRKLLREHLPKDATPEQRKAFEKMVASFPETARVRHDRVNEVVQDSILKIDRNHDWQITGAELSNLDSSLKDNLPKLVEGLKVPLR